MVGTPKNAYVVRILIAEKMGHFEFGVGWADWDVFSTMNGCATRRVISMNSCLPMLEWPLLVNRPRRLTHIGAQLGPTQGGIFEVSANGLSAAAVGPHCTPMVGLTPRRFTC